ncbi:MAG: nuclear transport factor 2 family protein [Pseudomonadota bacterium]
MSAIIAFTNYFQAFEAAVATGRWEDVADHLAEDVHYAVLNVPFACELKGRNQVVAGMQRSLANFDHHMDARLLDIVSLSRLDETRLRAELVSGYERGDAALRIPVSMDIRAVDGRITELTDIYDPTWVAGALSWLATHASDLDPSYQ